MLSEVRKRRAAMTACGVFLAVGSYVYLGKFYFKSPDINGDDRVVGKIAAVQTKFKVKSEENPLTPALKIAAPEGRADTHRDNARIKEAQKRAETLFYEWEKANTKNLTFLNKTSTDQQTNSNFLLPKLELATLNEIAEQSSAGLGKNIYGKIVQHVKQTAGRPLQKFRYLHLKVGESASQDKITYADIDDEKSFTVDPVSGNVRITSDTLVFDTLGDVAKLRYQHLFKIAE